MSEKLDRLLEQYSAAAGEFWLEENLPDDIPEHTFSHKFQRNMNKLLRRQRRSPAVRAALAYARRAAIFVLAFVALSFSVRMTVDAAFRQQVLRVVVQVFSDFTEFRYTSDVKTDEQPGELEFTYLPEGMVETDRELDTLGFYICWKNKSGDFVELDQVLVDDNTDMELYLDTEDAEITHFQVHGEETIGIEKGLGHTIHWTEGQFVYTLFGTIPMEELKQVAEGICPASEPRVAEIEFGYLPEGMIEKEHELDEFGYYTYWSWEDTDGRFLELEQWAITEAGSSTQLLDTENAKITHFQVHGEEAMGIEKGLDHTIHWTEGQIVYVLLGRNLPMEELKLVAEGIK